MRHAFRSLLKAAAVAGAAALPAAASEDASPPPRPNVLLILADQWRAQATGYAGDRNARTPHLDTLARSGVNVSFAISGCPVCSPYRASLMTGQHPLTHGVFVNDVHLGDDRPGLAKAFAAGGYDTAYIGKWHLEGRGRSTYIPPGHRQGFAYWKALECTHAYLRSAYYAGDSDEKRFWDGYDAIAQTRDAQAYLRGRDRGKPFLLLLAWGPPHDPYQEIPESFKAPFPPDALALRPNVPEKFQAEARKALSGYYAHGAALDGCVGDLLKTLDETGLARDTIVVFTSDHGDMLFSQGQRNKQRPWDEAIRVPFLLRYPGRLAPREVPAFLDAPDILPTLLSLCGLPVPKGVEGRDFARCLEGGEDPSGGAGLLACYHPFAQWSRRVGGREYRAIRTRRYTYARSLDGPWLLYDNEKDPAQQVNLAGISEHAELQKQLDARLQRLLDERGDRFRPGADYLQQWNYRVAGPDEAVPYTQ